MALAARVNHVGRSLRRREDERLLQGRGTYVADVRRHAALHLAALPLRPSRLRELIRAALATRS